MSLKPTYSDLKGSHSVVRSWFQMSGLCALVTKAELEYWGIDELLMEPCCALKYYPEIELCVKEVEGEEISRFGIPMNS